MRASILFLFLLAVVPLAAQPEVRSRTTDSTLTQKWTSEFGYSFMLPATAKYNTIGSAINKATQTERQNFMIPGGNGAISIEYVTEQRILPKSYALLDSMHYYEVDSAGRNGTIHRRVYVLRDVSVQMDILLTTKGEKEYADRVKPIFDSFQPPPGASFTLEGWRYGRDPKEYQRGRSDSERSK